MRDLTDHCATDYYSTREDNHISYCFVDGEIDKCVLLLLNDESGCKGNERIFYYDLAPMLSKVILPHEFIIGSFRIHVGPEKKEGTIASKELSSASVDEFTKIASKTVDSIYFAFRDFILDKFEFWGALQNKLIITNKYAHKLEGFARDRTIAKLLESDETKEFTYPWELSRLIDNLKRLEPSKRHTWQQNQKYLWKFEWRKYEIQLVIKCEKLLQLIPKFFPELNEFKEHKINRLIELYAETETLTMNYVAGDLSDMNSLTHIENDYNNTANRFEIIFKEIVDRYSRLCLNLESLYDDDKVLPKLINYTTFLKQFKISDPSKKPELTQSHTPDILGYRDYILPYLPSLAKGAHKYISPSGNASSDPSGVYIHEFDRHRHTYITGGSGSGKSELIKVLVHAYVKRPKYCANVILDPHGDLAEEIAHWKEFAGRDRLIYIDPTLSSDCSPTINPFDIRGKTEELIDIASQEFTSVFKELLKGSGLTLQMETLLVPCIATIMRLSGTLVDLQRFMLDDLNKDLIAAGLRSPNPGHRNFFQMGFKSDAYSHTKRSIYTRIQSLLNTKAFYNLTDGKSSIDLEQALNDRKTIVFNLSAGKIGREAGSAFGRFIIAMLQSIALRRASIPTGERVPVHVFVDECHLFISDSIENTLTGSRKYGMHLTLAQQIAGQDMDSQLTKIVLGNTGVKFTGKNGLATLKIIANETGAYLEDLQRLSVGQFSMKTDDEPSKTIQVVDYLIGNRHSMTADEWQRVKADQLDKYYRSTLYVPPPDEGEDQRQPKYKLPDA